MSVSSPHTLAVSYAANDSTPTDDNGTNSNPATPLRPVKSSTGRFEFPAIWSFPPFFTLQPNPSTLTHQLNLWTDLVLGWAKTERIWTVDCDAADGGGEVFNNKEIARKLLPASKRQLLQHMTSAGHAIADPPKQNTTFLLYWRKPEEWGSIIYDWITDTGQTGTILTLFELTEGDLSSSTEHRELHPVILKRALDTLVRRGKAQIIKGGDGDGDGVRFL